jgi:hypothetical protein
VTSYLYDWTLSANFVNSNWQETGYYPVPPGDPPQPYGYGSTNYVINQDFLKTASPRAWWVSGGEKNARLLLSVPSGNGRLGSMAVRGQFSVFQPSVSLSTYTNVTPSFFYGYNYVLLGYIKLGGTGDPRVGRHEMAFDVLFDVGKFSGVGGIIQLLTADYSSRQPNFSDWRLDGDTIFYGGQPQVLSSNSPNQPPIFFDDSPQNGVPHTIRCKASFKDYIMFRPDAGYPSANIFVPLGIITWSCHGEAVSADNVTVDSVTGPDSPSSPGEFPTWLYNFPGGSGSE